MNTFLSILSFVAALFLGYFLKKLDVPIWAVVVIVVAFSGFTYLFFNSRK